MTKDKFTITIQGGDNMGRIANAVAGTLGTAVVSANCFFAGSKDDAVISQENANANNIANSNEAVLNIGSAPSDGIDVKDWLSDTSDAIEQAFEDAEKHDGRQEENETVRDSENNEQTAGSAPPNNDNAVMDSSETAGADLSPNNASEAAAVDYGNDMSDFGCDSSLDDSEGYSDSAELSDGLSEGEEDGMSM